MKCSASVMAALLMLAPLPAAAATPGAVQADQSPTMPAPAGDGNFLGKGRGKGGKLAGFFTPEQRAMFMIDARQQLKDMPADQKKAYRKEQISKIMAMSPGDREKLKADLQAKWDAMPPKRKARIEQRLASQGSAPPAQ